MKQLYTAADFFLARYPVLAATSVPENLFQFYQTNPLFQEAIAIASPSLHRTMKSLSQDDHVKVFPSLLKYFLRMTSRTTPFGLFAAVGWGKFSEKTDVQFKNNDLKKKVRPDMGWIKGVVDFCHQHQELVRNLHIMTNPHLLKSSGKVFLTKYNKESNCREQCSIRLTVVAEHAFACAATPILYSSLEEQLCRAFHDQDREKVCSYLWQLFQQGYFISELSPCLNQTFDLSTFIEKLKPSENHPNLRFLFSLNASLKAYENAPLGDVKALEEVLKQFELWKTDYPIQVDSYQEKISHLHPSIKDRLEEVSSLLWKLSVRNQSLSPYYTKFAEKYGQHRLVPILELISEVKGIGLPQSLDNSPSKTQRLIEEALSNHQKEIALDNLSLPPIPEETLKQAPLSLEVYFEINAASQEEVDKGRYTILMNPVVASMQAGSTFGRFLYLWNGAYNEQVKQLLDKESSLLPNTLFVEASFLPENSRTANVCFHEKLRPFQLQMHYHDSKQLGIPLTDIYVGIRNERLYLYSKKMDKEIYVSVSSAVNTDLAPPVLQCMLAICQMNVIPYTPFAWHGCFSLPYLPRIRYHNVIVSPARWYFSQETLGLTSKSSKEAVTKRIKQILQEKNVPPNIYLTHYDQRLLVDWTKQEHLDLIVSHFMKHFELIFFEKVLKKDKDVHTTEYVLPLVKKTEHGFSQNSHFYPPTLQIARKNRIALPGGEWMYAKLFLAQEESARFLTEWISPFTNTLLEKEWIDKWFYIRYQEEGKHHIRLRLHGKPDQLNSIVFPHLQQWVSHAIEQDLIRDFQLAIYEREIERYGGPECIFSAEDVFCADSLACCQLIKASKKFPMPVIGAIGIIYFLHHLKLDLSEMIELLSPIKHLNHLLAGHRQHVKLVTTYASTFTLEPNLQAYEMNREALQRFLSVIDQATLWNRKDWLIDSLLHMHCNRLMGTNQQLEETARVIALHGLTKQSYKK